MTVWHYAKHLPEKSCDCFVILEEEGGGNRSVGRASFYIYPLGYKGTKHFHMWWPEPNSCDAGFDFEQSDTQIYLGGGIHNNARYRVVYWRPYLDDEDMLDLTDGLFDLLTEIKDQKEWNKDFEEQYQWYLNKYFPHYLD